MKKIMLFGGALLAASLAMTESSYAQQRDSCECVNGIKCVWVNGNLECDPNITCKGTFTITPPIPPSPQPVNSTAKPVDIQATAFIPSLGTVQITLSPTAAAPSIIRSNNPGVRFPLTVELNFNAIAEIPGLPPFTSQAPLTYRTTNANSVDPFNNVELVLQNNVVFVSGPVSSFTLEAGSSKIVLGEHQGGEVR